MTVTVTVETLKEGLGVEQAKRGEHTMTEKVVEKQTKSENFSRVLKMTN